MVDADLLYPADGIKTPLLQVGGYRFSEPAQAVVTIFMFPAGRFSRYRSGEESMWFSSSEKNGLRSGVRKIQRRPTRPRVKKPWAETCVVSTVSSIVFHDLVMHFLFLLNLRAVDIRTTDYSNRKMGVELE